MQINKFTSKFQNILAEAQTNAISLDNPYIEVAHVFISLLNDSDGVAKNLISRSGGSIEGIKAALLENISQLPRIENASGEIGFSRELIKVLNLTEKNQEREKISLYQLNYLFG